MRWFFANEYNRAYDRNYNNSSGEFGANKRNAKHKHHSETQNAKVEHIHKPQTRKFVSPEISIQFYKLKNAISWSWTYYVASTKSTQ